MFLEFRTTDAIFFVWLVFKIPKMSGTKLGMQYIYNAF